jgi:dTDP-4-dehydrorhamnose reductase
MTQPILITGADGQVGRALQRALAGLPLVALNRQQLDLANPTSLAATIAAVQPSVIINAAAYTAVDKAESERDLAFAINATAPGVLAELARQQGIVFIHYSTDYVFDGCAPLVGGVPRPWREDDATGPRNVYGASKLAGEGAIQAIPGASLILRTSWVYDGQGKNFLSTMLRLGQTRDTLSIVDDQIGAPTTAQYIAESTATIVRNAQAQRDPYRAIQERAGLYHLTMGGAISWFTFAQSIFSQVKQQSPGTKTLSLLPIPSRDYPTPAVRPQWSVLDNERLGRVFGIAQTPWHDGLVATLPLALQATP